jgi:hypothetical protein
MMNRRGLLADHLLQRTDRKREWQVDMFPKTKIRDDMGSSSGEMMEEGDGSLDYLQMQAVSASRVLSETF